MLYYPKDMVVWEEVMEWTDERVGLLRKLWQEDGLSAAQIAHQLGGVSRSAVLSKVRRLQLSGRERTANSKQTPKNILRWGNGSRKRTPPTWPVHPHTLNGSATIIPISRHLPLAALSERTCKWPSGEGKESTFCGNETERKGPYCPYHSRVAYQPVIGRRRVR